MYLRKALMIVAMLVAAAGGAAWAQNAPYATLSPPQPTGDNGKIEVIEFFWYGCPHCYHLEPEVNAWLKRKPNDVVFKRVPAAPSESWAEGAKIYYTLEAMGLIEQYHQKVFDAIHKDNINLQNQRLREEWLKKNGIDVAKYNETEKSFTVASKLSRAKQMTQSYKVDGVPRLIVNGKYYTSGEQAGKPDQVFVVVDQLIEMSRREAPKSAATPTPAAPAKATKK
jgi:protein dithiol oxidoreductase (disulfide-forming)